MTRHAGEMAKGWGHWSVIQRGWLGKQAGREIQGVPEYDWWRVSGRASGKGSTWIGELVCGHVG